jgi:hypothetical protein
MKSANCGTFSNFQSHAFYWSWCSKICVTTLGSAPKPVPEETGPAVGNRLGLQEIRDR